MSLSVRSLSRFLVIAPVVCMLLTGCGYVVRGQQGAILDDAVLGDGTKTLKIQSVDQTTMFSWLPYIVRSALRDGINERGLARWSNGLTDYTISVNITNYSNTNDNRASGASYLYTVSLAMDFIVYDGRTNKQLWRSGNISYSNSFQNESEDEAVRDIAKECVRRGLDRLQQRF